MTEARIRQIAAKAIAQTPIESWKYYHVCWWEEQIQCHHVRHTLKPHEVFFIAPGYGTH